MNKIKELDIIYNEDCIEGMKKIPKNKIDLVITDPPFGIDFKAKKANYNRKLELVLSGYNEISNYHYPKFTKDWINQVFRILKNDGSIYVFTGFNHLEDIIREIRLAGFTIMNHIVWKYQFGVVTKRKYVTSHYMIIYAVKNPKKYYFNNNCRFKKDDKSDTGRSLRYADMEDVWVIKREYWKGEMKVPTKLPYEIIDKIMSYSSKKNHLVLDPFMGSGQVGKVAKEKNRHYIGYEIVKKYWKFANSNIKKTDRKGKI